MEKRLELKLNLFCKITNSSAFIKINGLGFEALV
jgi:hypothetical protein